MAARPNLAAIPSSMPTQISCDPAWPDVGVAHKQAVAVAVAVALRKLEREVAVAVALHRLARVAEVRRRFVQPGSGLLRQNGRSVQ